MDLMNLDDLARRTPFPGQQDRGRLLMSFGDSQPVVRFSFYPGDQVDVTRMNGADQVVGFLGGGLGSTRQYNDVGLTGPGGSDDDVVERVVIGPTGDEAPDVGEGSSDV